MSKHETDEDHKTLPKPIAITPEQLRQVAAGIATAVSNSNSESGTATSGPPR
jgi:hypothetical protein